MATTPKKPHPDKKSAEFRPALQHGKLMALYGNGYEGRRPFLSRRTAKVAVVGPTTIFEVSGDNRVIARHVKGDDSAWTRHPQRRKRAFYKKNARIFPVVP